MSRKKKKNKNKKKKGTDMSFWDKTKQAIGFAAKTKPEEKIDPETLSVALFKQSLLDEIAEDCLPKAGGSEFQVHYRGVQFLIEKPNSNKRLVFTIPTVFFNMPQTVTSGSVDYTLDDVADAAKAVKPISDALAEKIAAAFPLAYFEKQGFIISAREAEMGSMHRHPGNFGFSGIDLDNQVEKPGIIFRRLECEDLIQVDSVMYIPNNSVQLVTTETRAITVKPSSDGGIEGEYLESPTMHYILQDKETTSDFGEFFGSADEAEKEFKFKYAKKWYSKDYPEIEEVLKVFLSEMDYEPIAVVDPELIKQFASTYSKPGRTYGYNRGSGYHNANAWDDYDYGDEYYTHGVVTKPDPVTTTTGDDSTPMTAEEKRMIHRPTWRPTQTLSLLRTRKIDLDKYPNIDGKASDEDMLAIVQALKDADYDDADVKVFLQSTGYPAQEAINRWYENLTVDVDVTDDSETEQNTVDGNEATNSSSIVALLKSAKDQEDLFDSIDILFDSDMEEDEIKMYLDEAGFPEVTLVEYYRSYPNVDR